MNKTYQLENNKKIKVLSADIFGGKIIEKDKLKLEIKKTHFIEPGDCDCKGHEGPYKFNTKIDVKGDSVDKLIFYRYYKQFPDCQIQFNGN